MEKSLQIAIDGPAAAGKGTVSKILADRLGLLYIYSGAMYRAVALEAKRKGLSWDDEAGLTKLIKGMKIELLKPNAKEKLVTILVNGEDVSEAIMAEEIGKGGSEIAVFGKVRQLLVKRQRQLAEKGAVVMEGRDIGTVVLPKADLKIFLTGTLAERARRRYKQLVDRGERVSQQQVWLDMKGRDKKDSSREKDPLVKAADAWVLDTTKLNIEQVVSKIIEELNRRQLL